MGPPGVTPAGSQRLWTTSRGDAGRITKTMDHLRGIKAAGSSGPWTTPPGDAGSTIRTPAGHPSSHLS
ncbi:MAG: hypothetical protein U5L72_04265 [Bacteroidales bacterium]|nr:hypothetical protein [Bacteroidales bacterium]